MKEIIDEYISNQNIATIFYINREQSAPINYLLYTEFSKHKAVEEYLNEQTLLHAPELLI